MLDRRFQPKGHGVQIAAVHVRRTQVLKLYGGWEWEETLQNRLLTALTLQSCLCVTVSPLEFVLGTLGVVCTCPQCLPDNRMFSNACVALGETWPDRKRTLSIPKKGGGEAFLCALVNWHVLTCLCLQWSESLCLRCQWVAVPGLQSP